MGASAKLFQQERERELIDDITEYGYYSDCCGADIVMGDICLECKEHCSPFEDIEEDF